MIRVAGVQIVNPHIATTKEQLEENVKHSCSVIREHHLANNNEIVSLYVLSELSSCTYDEKAFVSTEVTEDPLDLTSPSFHHYGQLAQELSVYICFGFQRRLSSTTKTVAQAVVNKSGEVEVIYNKQHLCSFGDCKENDYFVKGDCKDTDMYFDLNGIRIGLAICYDLRFPEHFRHLAKLGCDLVCHCSAFPTDGYSATWPMFVQTRALENQFYVLSVNEQGASMFVPPWIIASKYQVTYAAMESVNDLLMGRVEKSIISELREQVPLRRDSGLSFFQQE